MNNYIEGRNPYKLAQPSPWWLQLLYDYDSLLVVMPSVKDCTYRLCRRVPRNRRLGNLVKYLHTHPDTVQMITFGLVPVSTLTTWAIQSDKIIRDLMARDTTRVGGGDGALKVIEANEQRAVERKEKTALTDLDARSGEAFRSMQFRNGSAISMTKFDKLPTKTVISPRTPGRLALPRDPVASTARQTTQITLTDPA